MRKKLNFMEKVMLLVSMLVLIPVMSIVSQTGQDFLAPSYDPPKGLTPEQVPLFIVLGFDDNRYVDGMEWVLNMLKDKKNPAGLGNPATFDGTPIGASFYFTTGALESGGQPLIDTWKEVVARNYEVANHTVTHNTGQSTPLSEWVSEMTQCRDKLVEVLGIDSSEVLGFRTPYLAFNDATFQAVKDVGFLYECTMTQMQDYNKSQFVWPYTLDNGFPDKVIEGWQGKCKQPGLWEIPVYTVAEDASTFWPPITGFDSTILLQGNGNKFEQMFKNAVDYRLKAGGNRAPITIGLHSDTYAASNPDGWKYDNALNLQQRQQALENIIDYALQHPEVRIVSAVDMIEWLRAPRAFDDMPNTPTPTPTIPVTPTPTTTITPVEYVNIAPGKNIYAKSQFSADFPVTNANDGNTATAWGSNITDASQWLYIDLGAPTPIDGLRVKWFAPFYAKSYDIYISNDAQTWTKAVTINKANGNDDELLGSASIRYIGLLFKSKNDAGYGIREFEVLQVK